MTWYYEVRSGAKLEVFVVYAIGLRDGPRARPYHVIELRRSGVTNAQVRWVRIDRDVERWDGQLTAGTLSLSSYAVRLHLKAKEQAPQAAKPVARRSSLLGRMGKVQSFADLPRSISIR